jgi:uncharacterized protein
MQEPNARPASERVRVRRKADRGRYDAELVHQALDEALICHVGFVVDGQPYVQPTIHARVEDQVYLHGAVGNRMLKVVASGEPVCLTATIVDGLVLARSALHHSMNYRSVVILGRGRDVKDLEERELASRRLVDHVVPGRWAHVRPPTPEELRSTRVVALPLAEASVKVRAGPPIDDKADYGLPIWAGELPLEVVPRPPVPDCELPLPAHVGDWVRPQ